jgi:hypothetical protein
VLLPVVVLVTGAIPIRADATTFGLFFGLTFTLQQLSMRVLSRGCHRSVLSIVFELVRMTPNILATLTLVSHRRIGFQVTPKGRTGTARAHASEPRLLRWLAILSVAGGAWFALTLAGLTPTRYTVPWAAYATSGWLVLNVCLLVAAIGRVRDLRFAGERRASVRFATTLDGTLDGTACAILDLSLTGARVASSSATDLERHELVVEAGDQRIALGATIRSTRPHPAGPTVVGLEFLPDQNQARAALALALFHTTVVPATVLPTGDVPARKPRRTPAAAEPRAATPVSA